MSSLIVKYSLERTKRSISASLLYWRSLLLTLDTVELNIFIETTIVREKVTAMAIKAMVMVTPRLIFLLMGSDGSLQNSAVFYRV